MKIRLLVVFLLTVAMTGLFPPDLRGQTQNQTQQQGRPQAIEPPPSDPTARAAWQARQQHYYGLNPDSYGPMNIQVAQVYACNVPVCENDPLNRFNDRASRDWARSIMDRLAPGARAAGVQATDVMDPSLVREDLQGHFRNAFTAQMTMFTPTAGFIHVSYATVALLQRTPERVVFWYDFGSVLPRELDAAAADYCSKRGRTAVSAGAARGCSETPRSQWIGGPTANTCASMESHYNTFVIATYNCERGTAASETTTAPPAQH